MFKGFVREGELRRWAPWIGVALLILLAVALETSMESVCWDQEAAKAVKVGDAAGCFEFWFNRYQAIIGAAATIIAGWLAFAGAMKQATGTDAQVKILRKQIFSETVSRLSDLISYISAIFVLMEKAASAQCEAINNFNFIKSKSELYAAAEAFDGKATTEDMSGVSGEINRNLNAINDSADKAFKLLEEARMPQQIHEAASQFFEKSKQEYQKLISVKKSIDRPLAQNQLFDLRLHDDMRAIVDAINRREREIELKQLADYALVNSELRRLKLLRDSAIESAESRDG
ncbi:hypothetical protein [Methylobacterium sp. NEAU K]|uniref:hypothetical protein n=1 Tax=Methylobacterium sp. NEAU K TaxID=3064946 RepID=UPI0027325067|nr:hypothetical protein [Methylobacterium sp. NEAU K]MDP4005120.1 hypothetical protein [Methylobacterium sp. NEAU K]